MFTGGTIRILKHGHVNAAWHGCEDALIVDGKQALRAWARFDGSRSHGS